MIEPVLEALQFSFMRHALAAGLLVSVACGIIGTFVVIKRIVFISGGIAHAAYGGIGLGYFVKYSLLPALFAGSAAAQDQRPGSWPLLGAILFSLGAALIMGLVQRRTRQRADTIIGVLWAIGMAIGIIFVDLSQGYKVDLMSYLFGSILAVERSELLLILGLDVVIVTLVILFYKELLAISFDETFATVENVPVDAIYLVLLCLIALTVVMMMRIVGLIMVIAMLTMPAAIAGRFVKDMKHMMVGSTLLGMLFTVVGLWLSYAWNLTSGASIILVSGVGYLFSLAAPWLWLRRTYTKCFFLTLSLLTLTTCSRARTIKITEYALLERPQVQDLDVSFQVVGKDSQDILASRQRFVPSHQLVTPVYVDGQLLSVETQARLDGDHVRIYAGKALIYSRLLDDLDGNASIKPWGVAGGWVIEFKHLKNGNVKGNIIQDGQELNERMGYDESFGFVLLAEKPFYFYEKNAKIGFSYDGQEHELGYEQALHYGCCNDSFLDPQYLPDSVSFFGRQNSQWYYVEIQIVRRGAVAAPLLARAPRVCYSIHNKSTEKERKDTLCLCEIA